METCHITSACSRISKPLRALLTADAGRYAAYKLNIHLVVDSPLISLTRELHLSID